MSDFKKVLYSKFDSYSYFCLIRILGRGSYRFRNSILDFDIKGDQILVSSFSDGLDILKYSKDSASAIVISAFKGDKISRSCISCVWISESTFAVSDKHRNVFLCQITPDNVWIKTISTIRLCEIALILFMFEGLIHCETISGSIIDLSQIYNE